MAIIGRQIINKRNFGVELCPYTWPGSITLTHPDLIRQIHEDYIRIGAEVIIANTFATKRSTLNLGGFGDQTVEINKLAVQLAQDARKNVHSSRSVAIAGSLASMTPIPDAYRYSSIRSGSV